MKFTTVRAIVGADGNVTWNVWKGMKMIEADFGRWVRGHSLLRFTLDRRFIDLIGDHGIVMNGYLFRDKVEEEDEMGIETVLQRVRSPHRFTKQMYIALEVEDPHGMLKKVGAFNTHFGRPQEMRFRDYDNRLSQVWQVEIGGGVVLTTWNGRKWHTRCKELFDVDVIDALNNQVEAVEGPYPIDWKDPFIIETGVPEFSLMSLEDQVAAVLREYDRGRRHLMMLQEWLHQFGCEATSRYAQPDEIYSVLSRYARVETQFSRIPKSSIPRPLRPRRPREM